MGLSASQARFLMLTGRKSDLEFQAQQVNQQRTSLSRQSSQLFNKLMNLTPPAPTQYAASENDYSQKWWNDTTDGGNNDGIMNINELQFDDFGLYKGWGRYLDIANAGGVVPANSTQVMSSDGSTVVGYIIAEDKTYTALAENPTEVGGLYDWKSFNNEDITNNWSTTELENETNDNYERALAAYDHEITDANLKISEIHEQDRALELQLKNIDTQHSAVQTEVDAVNKVIKKNIESSFKTFG